MTDGDQGTDVAARLQVLRADSHLTLAEMAALCGLPKSSLESYMKSEGARKPGVEALIGIATGMGVSVDWILGLTDVRYVSKAARKDFAVACMAVVDSLLARLEEEQAKSPSPIIQGQSFAGVQRLEIATRALVSFLQILEKLEEAGFHGTAITQDDISELHKLALTKMMENREPRTS